MITLKKIIEGFDSQDDSFINHDVEDSSMTNEIEGRMGYGPTTWDTPKAFSPEGSPVRTNEQQPAAPVQSQPTQQISRKLTKEEKVKLLEMVGQFNGYRKAMKMADELKNVAESIVYIAEMTEKYGLNETSDWFEGVSLERDMKELKKTAGELHKIANKVHPQIKQAEALYEEIGLRLERYYNL
jgi:hypothetical protein